MGMRMCSISNGEKGDVIEFKYDMNWDTSEEQEASDDDNEYFNLGRMGKCISLPDLGDLEKVTELNRAKTEQVLRLRGCSYQEKMKEWQRSSVVNRDAEFQAKNWCKKVTEDTLNQLSNTVLIADSIAETGVAINNELARQDRVLWKNETDIDKATQTLMGMRSWRSKLKKVVWKKEPKIKINVFNRTTSSSNNVNLDLFEDVGSYPLSKLECRSSTLPEDASEDIKQLQIKEGMGQLHKALDTIAMQQMDIAWALNTQDARLAMFENRMTTTNEKINEFCMKSRVMGKS